MPLHAPSNQFESRSGGPKGIVPRHMFGTEGRGLPRTIDVRMIRLLENTPTIALPMSIISRQISGATWNIIPDEEFKDSEKHKKACADIVYFLSGRYNSNEDSFNMLQEQFGKDLISVGSGVVEKAFEEGSKYLGALYPRDAGAFTKVLDEHGVLPTSDSGEAAYYQWAGIMAQGGFSQGLPSSESVYQYAKDSQYMYSYHGAKPIDFLRNEIIWSDYNTRSWDSYGRGIIADAQLYAEVALNMVLLNKKDFSEDMIPPGMLFLLGGNPEVVTAARNYFETEVKGKPNTMPIIGGPDPMIWTPFRGTPKELEFLESNQWYAKMVWMMFGLNANEVGDIAEVTRPGGTAQFSTDVWRKTTFPLLSQMEETWNRHLLPFLEPYQRVKGGIHFTYTISHPDAEDQMRARQEIDLKNGTITINQALEARGEEAVPWGNMTQGLYDKFIEMNHIWFFEEFIEMDTKPESPVPGPETIYPLISGATSQIYTPNEVRAHTGHESMEGGDEMLEPMLGGGGDPLAGLSAEQDAIQTMAPDKPNKRFFPYPMMRKGAEEMEEIESEDFNDESFLFSEARRLSKSSEKIIFDELKSFQKDLLDVWPDSEKSLKAIIPSIPISTLLQSIGFAQSLSEEIHESDKNVIENQFKEDAKEIEDEIKEQTGEDVSFEIHDPSEDSVAMQVLDTRAETASIKVEQDVRDQIGTLLHEASENEWSIQELTENLNDRITEISQAKSRLIARTEIMQANRGAAQIFADSTDLIAGKGWSSTKDSRVRKHHLAMDGVEVPKEGSFTVPKVTADQGGDYPKDTFIVGGDQPFNCRCTQYHVLADDMPDDISTLCARFPEVKRIETGERTTNR